MNKPGSRSSLNILFVLSDQERYIPMWPARLDLPGHEWLARTGTTFRNHYNSATMCARSRSVLMTGLQTADSGMFDNCDVPYIKALSTGIPTIGHTLGGYNFDHVIAASVAK